MKVPNSLLAVIDDQKIHDYLLNMKHPEGAAKASFFLRLGFDPLSLKETILNHVRNNEFIKSQLTLFGTKYIVESTVNSPNDYSFKLRTVWIISSPNKFPIFITAYPVYHV